MRHIASDVPDVVLMDIGISMVAVAVAHGS